jgi:hypothetical protein
MRPVLLKLAHRFLTSGDLGITAERFYLHLSVLKELQSWDEADTLINSEAGKVFCNAMLACDELRRETVRARGAWQQEAVVARERILEKKSVNLLFLRLSIVLMSHKSETGIGWNSFQFSMPHSPRVLLRKRPLARRKRSLQPSSLLATFSCESRKSMASPIGQGTSRSSSWRSVRTRTGRHRVCRCYACVILPHSPASRSRRDREPHEELLESCRGQALLLRGSEAVPGAGPRAAGVLDDVPRAAAANAGM